MQAYKAFEPGLICRGYQFHMGTNVASEANCARNGFHCAEDPLDCLTYYPDIHRAVYCLVRAGGDIDEDAADSKIACTELKILRVLSLPDYFLHILLYLAKHPHRGGKGRSRIADDSATARNGYAIVKGRNPMARGELGDILAMAQENADGDVVEIAVHTVDGKKLRPGVYYDITGREVPMDV